MRVRNFASCPGTRPRFSTPMSDYFERFVQCLMIDPARPVARLAAEYQEKHPVPTQIQGLPRA